MQISTNVVPLTIHHSSLDSFRLIEATLSFLSLTVMFPFPAVTSPFVFGLNSSRECMTSLQA
ncbi:transmembrane protein, putative [Medicago truncatula]|uniref:Transmembrane protein, putative n=1 Tax=Medicago truncatula TaxID=3880 RepID=G7LEF3_MEDTR|nr:transmembrane protein, putative [Medicago truncatula]